MDFLGIGLDKEKNWQYSRQLREINIADAGVKILAIPTNEEMEIAHQYYDLLQEQAKPA